MLVWEGSRALITWACPGFEHSGIWTMPRTELWALDTQMNGLQLLILGALRELANMEKDEHVSPQ